MRTIFRLTILTTMLLIIAQSAAIAGVIFTINNTDLETGETSSMEIIVDGLYLKMEFLDVEYQNEGIEIVRDIESVPDMLIIDEPDSGIDVGSDAVADASGTDMARDSADTDSYSQAQESDMVYRADLREMVIIDHESKEYFVLNEDFLNMAKDRIPHDTNPAMGDMNSMMQQAYDMALAQLDTQNLSADERAAAEQVLKNTFGMVQSSRGSGGLTLDEPEEIIERGEETTMNGYPVTVYRTKIDTFTSQQFWMTYWKNLGPGRKAKDTIKSFFDFQNSMMNLAGAGRDEDDELDFFLIMNEFDGMPVYGKTYKGNNVTKEFSLESVTERDIDPHAFEPPKGYRLRTMGL